MPLFKIPKALLKGVGLFLICLALFEIVASTIPYLRRIRIGAAAKEDLERTTFLGSGLPGPDRACLIEKPVDALNVRLAMLRRVTTRLDITSHVVRAGESSAAFLGEVLQAADRGVAVRLFLDGKAGTMSRQMIHTMQALDTHENISVRFYNPLDLRRPWKLHALLHDKFILVDGELLLLGGRNVDDRHFGPKNFHGPLTHDRDVLIWKNGASSAENRSALEQVQDYMELLWDCKDAVAAEAMDSAKRDNPAYFAGLLQMAEEFGAENPVFYQYSMEDYLDRTVPTSRITLLNNPIHTDKKEPWVAWQMRRLALTAEQFVLVQTPYATANTKLLETVREASSRAQVVFLTNSVASSPNLPAFSNYRYQREDFLQAGAEIYEYQLQDSIHGKSMVIDQRLALVGSFNMDDRSIYIDTETMLVIDSPEFSQLLTAAIADGIQQSLQVGADNRYIIPVDGVEEAEVSTAKQVLMRLAYILLRPFQFLL